MNGISFDVDNQKYALVTNDGIIYGSIQPFSKNKIKLGPVDHVFITGDTIIFNPSKDNGKYPDTDIIIWSITKGYEIGKIEFEKQIFGISGDSMFISISLKEKSYVYNLDSLELKYELVGNYSIINDDLAISWRSQSGDLHVQFQAQQRHLTAHQSAIKCVAVSKDKRHFATASLQGTIVRIWNVDKGDVKTYVRRGFTQGEIRALCFSPCGRWLCTGGRKLYLFDLSKTTILSPHYSVIELETPGMVREIGFDDANNIYIITSDGIFIQYTLQLKPISLIPQQYEQIWYKTTSGDPPTKGVFIEDKYNTLP
jgi:WD40 repeat protein